MNFKNKILESAKRTIELESKSIYNLLNYLDDDFVKAVEYIYNSSGKVVITGIGKSAAIANKIAIKSNPIMSKILRPFDIFFDEILLINFKRK